MNIPRELIGEPVVQTDYHYHAAGRIWKIPEVKLQKYPDGHLNIGLDEITRINEAISNEICGKSNPMTGGELEFLCDATDTRYIEVAKKFQVSKGNVSHWVSSTSPISFERSLILKRWFWAKMFSDRVSNLVWDIQKVARFVDDDIFFSALKSVAIDTGVTFEVKQAS